MDTGLARPDAPSASGQTGGRLTARPAGRSPRRCAAAGADAPASAAQSDIAVRAADGSGQALDLPVALVEQSDAELARLIRSVRRDLPPFDGELICDHKGAPAGEGRAPTPQGKAAGRGGAGGTSA